MLHKPNHNQQSLLAVVQVQMTGTTPSHSCPFAQKVVKETGILLMAHGSLPNTMLDMKPLPLTQTSGAPKQHYLLGSAVPLAYHLGAP